jgi:hypothetical protein
MAFRILTPRSLARTKNDVQATIRYHPITLGAA